MVEAGGVEPPYKSSGARLAGRMLHKVPTMAAAFCPAVGSTDGIHRPYVLTIITQSLCPICDPSRATTECARALLRVHPQASPLSLSIPSAHPSAIAAAPVICTE